MRGGAWKFFRRVSSLDQGGHNTPGLEPLTLKYVIKNRSVCGDFYTVGFDRCHY